MGIDVGAVIYIALKPILKIYAIIFVGFLLAKYDVVSMEVARGISNMVVNAILPCLTFNKIVGNISWHDIRLIGVIVLSAFVLFALGGACSLGTKFATPSPKQWFWGLMFGGIFPNISDLPIAYMQSMGGGQIFTEDQANRGVAYTCIFLFTQSFLMMNVGMWRIVGMDFKDGDDNEKESEDVEEVITEGSPKEALDDSRKSAGSSTLPEAPTVVKVVHRAPTNGESLDSDDEFEMYSIDSYVSRHFEPAERTEQEEPVAINQNRLGRSTMSKLPPSIQEEQEISPEPAVLPPTKLTTMSSICSSPAVIRTFRVPRNPTNKPHPSAFNKYARSLSITDALERKLSKTRSNRSIPNSMIAEYSAAEKIKSGELDLRRPLTLTKFVGDENAFGKSEPRGIDEIVSSQQHDEENPVPPAPSNDTGSIVQENSGKKISLWKRIKLRCSKFIRKYKLGWLTYFLINCIRPASLGALLGIICALIPWVKALFVPTYVHVHMAPDQMPVLNFIMDFTAYIGNACVPLGLLMLGGTLARLEVESIPEGFLKTVVSLTVCRLVVIPIIGVLWANKLYDLGWLNDNVSKFIMILTFSMPSATAQVYFTAFYSPVTGAHQQMDCLSIFFIAQYGVLFITLSIVVTYALKVDLKV